MNATPRVIAGLTSVAAAALLADTRKFDSHHTGIQAEQLQQDDFWNQTRYRMADYSQYPFLMRMKHAILNPANWHFITVPMTHVKGWLNSIWDNIVPIGLASVGLIYAFNGSILKVCQNIGKGISTCAKPVGKGLYHTGKAACRVLAGIPWSGSWFRGMGPKGILATACGFGMLAWLAKLTVAEFNGDNRENIMNYIDTTNMRF